MFELTGFYAAKRACANAFSHVKLSSLVIKRQAIPQSVPEFVVK